MITGVNGGIQEKWLCSKYSHFFYHIVLLFLPKKERYMYMLKLYHFAGGNFFIFADVK